MGLGKIFINSFAHHLRGQMNRINELGGGVGYNTQVTEMFIVTFIHD